MTYFRMLLKLLYSAADLLLFLWMVPSESEMCALIGISRVSVVADVWKGQRRGFVCHRGVDETSYELEQK